MPDIIELNHVTKRYGPIVAVNNVSLTVPKGVVFGFLGPNGAGKSTTINMLIDFIRPTNGKVKLFGLDSTKDSLDIRRRIGFLAGDFALDKGLTGWQQLEYFGSLRENFDKKYIRELASRLDCKLDRKFKTLSRGNKQKVGLIAALMHKPELLIFDEPTSGLDPLIQAEFNKIILEQKQRGATTFISSHVLSEVQEICDHVAFVRNGKIVANKPLSEIIQSAARVIEITGLNKATAAAITKVTGVQNSKLNDSKLTVTFNGDINKLLKVLASINLIDVVIKEADLESIFMHFYGDGDV
jgi:ABC-2 type transport system ATP-binding protein